MWLLIDSLEVIILKLWDQGIQLLFEYFMAGITMFEKGWEPLLYRKDSLVLYLKTQITANLKLSTCIYV